MERILLSMLVSTLFVAQLCAADVLCIKKSNKVIGNKVTLSNAVIVQGSSCPAKYILLADIASFLTDGEVTTAKIAAGAVTEDKLAAGIVLRSLSLNPYGSNIEGGAVRDTGFGANAGLSLPDSGTPAFAQGFTLPQDYISGTTIKVDLLWHTSATGCTIEFVPDFISVARAGRAHLVGPGATTGLSVDGGNVLTAASTSNNSVKTMLSITSPTSAALEPGDAIIFGVFRRSTSGADTCAADMRVQGMLVRY